MKRPLSNLHFRLLAMVVIYVMLKFLGGSLGNLALYPVTLFVTFLHEFGHALAGILTGGTVEGMRINPDGSGLTRTTGGSQGIILMGGYLGSAILGNLLFYIGAHKRSITQMSLYAVAICMAFAGIVWFESIESTTILLVFAASLFLIANKTNWDQDVLMFLGLAAVLYILQDFNVGPKSDLAMYEQVVGIFPYQVWMYVWLIIVILLSYSNLKSILQRR
ncbi:MAG: M50 family metallopeptidase [Bacteroidota bacterium]